IKERRYENDVVAGPWRIDKFHVALQCTATVQGRGWRDVRKRMPATHIEPQSGGAANEHHGSTADLCFELRLTHATGLGWPCTYEPGTVGRGVFELLAPPIVETDVERPEK